ncbi:MAG: hypothetical protein M0Z46_16790 [Actinomycetota bacterium]|nr:hypothetical protein [Actinomycetota bacterium]
MLGALALGTAACGAVAHAAGPHAHLPGRRITAPSPATHSTTTGPTGARSTTSGPTGAQSTTTGPTGAPSTSGPPTTTSAPPGRHGPVTEPPLPPAGPGFVADKVTAVGDSVMIDYAKALEADIPGIEIDAAVSRQWATGVAILQRLASQSALGAVVIVGLGTNGPITSSDFDSMMTVLSGASRVVFVNDRVDRAWQDSNNAVLAQGVARFPRAVLVDWYALAVRHPGWLYATQTHLPIDGPGAAALAALVAAAA